MGVLSLERIAAIRADPARRTRALDHGHVDRTRPFLPEDQTQLYYTPSYSLLSREQRIRYNQLFALRVNEYIMMLERDFVEPVLRALRARAIRAGSDALGRELDAMRAEEAAHFAAFAQLNRTCEPQAYRDADHWFMHLKPYERATICIMNASARWLPFALWIIVAMEESSIGLAAAMVRAGETSLGPLDPHFVAVHREHAKDEARHIHVDVHLVRACLHGFPPFWRAVNAGIFKAFMRDMTAPKANGTGARVVRQLVREHPELVRHEAELVAGLTTLRHHPEFQRSLFNRRLTPLAFALYDEEPALADLGQLLPGYERSV
jgi:predicted metal-dependent hydrolase